MKTCVWASGGPLSGDAAQGFRFLELSFLRRPYDSLWPTRIQSPGPKVVLKSQLGSMTDTPKVAFALHFTSCVAPVVVTVTAPTSGNDSRRSSRSLTPAPKGTSTASPRYEREKALPLWFAAAGVFEKTSTTCTSARGP